MAKKRFQLLLESSDWELVKDALPGNTESQKLRELVYMFKSGKLKIKLDGGK